MPFYFLKDVQFPASSFLFSSFLLYNWQVKFCGCLDSNRGSLMLEATALPTEPQPLTEVKYLTLSWARYRVGLLVKQLDLNSSEHTLGGLQL